MANVEVILLERVPKLGQMGDVVKVKPGFARNFLLPQKKALRATSDNRKYFDSRRKDLEANNLKRKQEAEAVATQMAGFQVVLIRQASESLQLYGSVTARDIAEAAVHGSNDKSVKLERSQVELAKPIKSLGLHKVQVHLHPEVVVEITANVARSADEAQFQAKGGVIMAETDRAQQEAALAQAAAEAAAQALFEKSTGDQPDAEEPPAEEAETKTEEE
jgi:large subunit ribosomal protein L9